MIDIELLSARFEDAGLSGWSSKLAGQIDANVYSEIHGDFDRWNMALASLPALNPSIIKLDQAVIQVGVAGDTDATSIQKIEDSLRILRPWRKGPYEIFSIFIDTEWRSDWKWARLYPHITELTGRKVLDVGCGSGYHCWRMAGAGAELVVGIDPSLLFSMQFQAIQHFVRDDRVWMLPVGIDDVPPRLAAFDTVFSMGVLYHRRSPIDHLYELQACLRPGGELVLETLVIDGDGGEVLVPKGRYAQMRNVWFIPTVKELQRWMERCGYEDVRVVDVTTTSMEEQRATDWMQFQSLPDFLDVDDKSRTVEGYPAPKRTIILAKRSA